MRTCLQVYILIGLGNHCDAVCRTEVNTITIAVARKVSHTI
jgi:hypothetical protein